VITLKRMIVDEQVIVKGGSPP